MRFLLLPLAWLYHFITGVRNLLFDWGWKQSATFDVPVISVGNLAVGGTGKTPHIEYLVRHLPLKTAILSRGYGRKTKGYLLANHQSTPQTIGDEPMQFFLKFGHTTPVAVGEKRALAIPKLLADCPQAQAILLDDAFQHRSVRPSFQMLLTEWHRPFTRDYLLPTGRLRESRMGAKRADVVIVTKCPATATAEQKEAMRAEIRPYTRPGTPVFFSEIVYEDLRQLGQTASSGREIWLVTGIVNPAPIVEHLQALGYRVKSVAYPDHHAYTETEINRLVCGLPPQARIVLTEKDAVKWQIFRSVWEKSPVYDLPIAVRIPDFNPSIALGGTGAASAPATA